MDWSKVGSFLLENGLPLLGGVLLGPAGAAGGKLVASALGLSREDPEEALSALQGGSEALAKLRELEARNRHELETLSLQAETKSIAEVNATYREEIKSEDKFVRRARPMFLYVIAFSVLVEVLIALIAVLWVPEAIGVLADLYSALSIPQGIADAMCGVYMKKRSDEKSPHLAARSGPGLLQAFATRVAGGRRGG